MDFIAVHVWNKENEIFPRYKENLLKMYIALFAIFKENTFGKRKKMLYGGNFFASHFFSGNFFPMTFFD